MDGNLAFLLNEMMVAPNVKKGVVTLISSLDAVPLEQVVITQMGITKTSVKEDNVYVEANGEKAVWYGPAEMWEEA
jgi:hypothetical protein